MLVVQNNPQHSIAVTSSPAKRHPQLDNLTINWSGDSALELVPRGSLDLVENLALTTRQFAPFT
jgi:hypothetical protein